VGQNVTVAHVIKNGQSQISRSVNGAAYLLAANYVTLPYETNDNSSQKYGVPSLRNGGGKYTGKRRNPFSESHFW
jgi:hypothetical protein